MSIASSTRLAFLELSPAANASYPATHNLSGIHAQTLVVSRRASTVSDTVGGACGNFASRSHSFGYPVSGWLLDLGDFAGSDAPKKFVASC